MAFKQKTMSEYRAEFVARLTDDPAKLAAYQSAMDAVKGDWAESNLVHMHFECMIRGIPFTDDEKREAMANGYYDRPR